MIDDNEGNQPRHRKDELPSRRRLAARVVDPSFDREALLGVVRQIGRYAWPNRGKRIEAFGAGVLNVLGLQLTGRHVVDACDAEDIPGSVLLTHVRRAVRR